ncbi:hypothetical protein [Chryseobacterium foetidum]|uniref:hypothetical protein n=1 Tax=Chryseobacterium foetidum TaxID=2951057 RepID=UPI0021C7E52F|nr:hypothetical protein [Chryseobacterium foetidum]
MKKLLLVAAFGVAGLMSANSVTPLNSDKLPTENKKSEAVTETAAKSVTEEQTEVRKEREFITCITFTMSCGWTDFVCGYSTFELMYEALSTDAQVCG